MNGGTGDTGLYARRVRDLYALQMFGIKMGLETIGALLAELGHPERRVPCIHVAGTNGKGSVSSLLAAMLTEAGLRTGLYTSPHLIDFRERIRVDGRPIPGHRVVELADRLWPSIERRSATFFEATTAMAFSHFADERVDVAVIETGMGGRLDATNVVRPLLSVITGIDLDHTEYLGTTIAEIAGEKAGIIKPATPVVTAAVQPEAVDVLRRVAREQRSPFERVELPTNLRMLDVDHMELTVRTGGAGRGTVSSALAGSHQARNIALAVAAMERAGRVLGIRGGEEAMRRGLLSVRERTGFTGRLQRIATDPELVIDVAHNPAGVAALLSTWRELRVPERTHIVFGLLANKDLAGVVGTLARSRWASITVTRIPGHLMHTASAVEEAVRTSGPETGHVTIYADDEVGRAVLSARERCGDGDSVLVFGSHYLVGAFLSGASEFDARGLLLL